VNNIECFLSHYGLNERDVIFIPYGSHVYGTTRKNSDEDYVAIVPENSRMNTRAAYSRNNIDIQVYNRRDFQDQLRQHKIHALEAWFHPSQILSCDFNFELRLTILRHSLSEKSSHSFVKAKKKIEFEHDYMIGWKSLFHSLRILNFGIQIAQDGAITNFGAANDHWHQIIEEKQTCWELLQRRYKPIYNGLATEFRKLAPKE
jgi:predicted nucleotidyltransferase